MIKTYVKAITDITREIAEITKIREEDTFKGLIFRGVNQIYPNSRKPSDDRVHSSLYRMLKEKKIKNISTFISHYQNNLVNVAKMEYFPHENLLNPVRILTPLRHFGGKINLIDFSKSFHVALFFACYGEEKMTSDGELFISKTVDFENEYVKDKIIEPYLDGISENRVNSQHSIFIEPLAGFLTISESPPFLISIKISANNKQKILECLDYLFDINVRTIYNDIFGFISNENNNFTFRRNIDLGFRKIVNYSNSNSEHNLKIAKKAFESVLNSKSTIWPDLVQNKVAAKLGIGIIYFYRNNIATSVTFFKEGYDLYTKNNDINDKNVIDKTTVTIFSEDFKQTMNSFADKIISKEYNSELIKDYIPRLLSDLTTLY